MKTFTAAIFDEHSVSLYDAVTGDYEGVLYIGAGKVMGTPIVSTESITINHMDGDGPYISVFSLPDKQFLRKIKL